MEQEIFELIKQGKSTTEISQMLNISNYNIVNTIKRSQYKDEILFLRSIKKAKMIDKDLVDEIVSLINQKYSFAEIAIYLSTTEAEIRSLLRYTFNNECSPYYDSSYYYSLLAKYENNLQINRYLIYQRLETLENKNHSLNLFNYSNSKFISEYKIYQNGKQMVYYYLNNDLKPTDEELSEKFNIRLAIINVILLNQHHLICLNQFLSAEKINLIREKRKEKAQVLKNQHHIDFQSKTQYFKTQIGEKKVEKILLNKVFWLKILLTFRLSLPDFAQLLGIEDLCVANDFVTYLAYQVNLTHAVTFLFSYAQDSKVNLNKASLFLAMFKRSKNNPEELKKVMSIINDSQYHEIVKKVENNELLTEEEEKEVARYHIKYALSMRTTPVFQRKINTLCKKYYPYEYELLTEHNNLDFQMVYRKKRKAR